MEAFAELIDSLPGDISREVVNELCTGRRLEEVRAAKEQLEIARAQPMRTWMNGLGRVRMTITPTAYHYWGQRLGYKCWKDKQFLREFERDNPEVRVRSQSRNIAVRVDGRKKDTETRGRGDAGKVAPGERVSAGGIILCGR